MDWTRPWGSGSSCCITNNSSLNTQEGGGLQHKKRRLLEYFVAVVRKEWQIWTVLLSYYSPHNVVSFSALAFFQKLHLRYDVPLSHLPEPDELQEYIKLVARCCNAAEKKEEEYDDGDDDDDFYIPHAYECSEEMMRDLRAQQRKERWREFLARFHRRQQQEISSSSSSAVMVETSRSRLDVKKGRPPLSLLESRNYWKSASVFDSPLGKFGRLKEARAMFLQQTDNGIEQQQHQRQKQEKRLKQMFISGAILQNQVDCISLMMMDDGNDGNNMCDCAFLSSVATNIPIEPWADPQDQQYRYLASSPSHHQQHSNNNNNSNFKAGLSTLLYLAVYWDQPLLLKVLISSLSQHSSFRPHRQQHNDRKWNEVMTELLTEPVQHPSSSSDFSLRLLDIAVLRCSHEIVEILLSAGATVFPRTVFATATTENHPQQQEQQQQEQEDLHVPHYFLHSSLQQGPSTYNKRTTTTTSALSLLALSPMILDDREFRSSFDVERIAKLLLSKVVDEMMDYCDDHGGVPINSGSTTAKRSGSAAERPIKMMSETVVVLQELRYSKAILEQRDPSSSSPFAELLQNQITRLEWA